MGRIHAKREIHAESPLQIPLVRQMLADPQVRLVARPIDARWAATLGPVSAGFNPFSGAVYYAATSPLASWLARPEQSAAPFNEDDALMRALLFAVHDYLHVWSYLAIRELCPALQFGTAEITTENFESFVFCHLVTEAVATVGLDYWYLSTVNIDDVLPIGTCLDTLTVGYHERDLREFRRLKFGFAAQTPDFFRRVVDSFCVGVFRGFSLDDMRKSPRLKRWLAHELSYSKFQRRYARQWFSYLSKESVRVDAADALSPITEKWQTQLIGAIGELLWDKVKNGSETRFSAGLDPAKVWASPVSKNADFRFVSADALELDEIESMVMKSDSLENRKFAAQQYVSRFECPHGDTTLLHIVAGLLAGGNLRALEYVLRSAKRVPGTKGTPRDLLQLQ